MDPIIWIWGIAFIFLIIIEVITPVELVGIWFMPAVIVCTILALFKVSYVTQLVVFALLIVVGTVLLFNRMKKKMDDSEVVYERFVGNFNIELNSTGRKIIRVKDVEYFIESNEELEVGQKVEVYGINGNKLSVRKVD